MKQQSNPIAHKRFFSVKEAAVYTGLSARSIYQKLNERAIRYYRAGGVQGKIILDVRDLDAFAMANEFKNSDQLRKILKEKLSEKRKKAGS